MESIEASPRGTELDAPIGEPESTAGTAHQPTTRGSVHDPVEPQHEDGAAARKDYHPSVQRRLDIEAAKTAAGEQDSTQVQGELHADAGAVLFDRLMHMQAVAVDDLETVRIAAENRLRTMVEIPVDKGGFGLTEGHPAVALQAAQVDGLKKLERAAVRALERALAAHPLGAWVEAQHGIGLKTVARLLGAIEDPYWHGGQERPRLVSELWSYCGVGDAARQRRRKGEKVRWSPEAKMRLWLIADRTVINRTPHYRDVYDAAKEKYTGALHTEACARCGPGKKAATKKREAQPPQPAAGGSPLSQAHIHARAVRLVMKEILRDLWLESRRLHELHADQVTCETQVDAVGVAHPLPGDQRTNGAQGLLAAGETS